MALRIILFSLIIQGSLPAQYDYQPVFPQLEGEALRSALLDAYKTNNVLTLSMTKDTLYRKVFLYNDSVRCIYTGLSRYLDPIEDPSQFLFGNGSSSDINLEHAYPRSKGAEQAPASSDMHSLFPSRVDVNTYRASKAYGEISDQDTDIWYAFNQSSNTIPEFSIDVYSEANAELFEPREEVKGDIARAMFYFYTFYMDEADLADRNFFSSMIPDLCRWHIDDPVDSLEWERTFKIANYQDDIPNPFILDCNLYRLHCADFFVECNPNSTGELIRSDLKIYPTLLEKGQYIIISSTYLLGKILEIKILSPTGTSVFSKTTKMDSASIRLEMPLLSGMYFIRLLTDDNLIMVKKVYLR